MRCIALEVIKLAKSRGYKNVLILEDDFQFLVSKEELETNLKSFFENYKDFDVCMLSYDLREFSEINNSVVNKILLSQSASGYIVNSNYYDKLIELHEWATPQLLSTKMHWIYACDVAWKDLQQNDNWYYFKTRIGKQRAGFSDNANCFANYDC